MSQQDINMPKCSAAAYMAKAKADIISQIVLHMESMERVGEVTCLTPEDFWRKAGNLKRALDREEFEQARKRIKLALWSDKEKESDDVSSSSSSYSENISPPTWSVPASRDYDNEYAIERKHSYPKSYFAVRFRQTKNHAPSERMIEYRRDNGCVLCGEDHEAHNCDVVTDPEERKRQFRDGEWCEMCGLHSENTRCPREVSPACMFCRGSHLTVLHGKR